MDDMVAVFFAALAFADFRGAFFAEVDFDEVFDLRVVGVVFFAVVDFCAKSVKS